MNGKSESYPDRETEVKRWHKLSRAVAKTVGELSESQLGKPDRVGRLIVLGSGIGAVGFTPEAEQHIRRADYVFYCVADPVTEVWLRKLRPDAYDLYVLYDDRKRRYYTYMQMSEVMLYHVRQGHSVAVIYYGHPGIFVLSTHRAIAIARREGHWAEMRPAVSSLDCLCADLGIDPSYPGLQTFEATDMLLRQRPIDNTCHVVLWQVGLIGELGFRRRGFINRHFNLLIEYLQKFYGKHFEITHYIAARYPTIQPTIERYRLSELLDPSVRSRLTGISTFYIPPKEARSIDMKFAAAVDLMKPHSRPARPSTLRTIDRYGPLEIRALEQLADFSVPPDYHYQTNTRAAEFLIELTENEELRHTYRGDPRKALSDKFFPGLTRRERVLLSSRQSGRVQLAAKGSTVGWAPGEQFVIDLLSSPSLAKSFNAELVEYAPQQNGYVQIDAWIASQGYQGVSILNYSPAAANVAASMLLAWSGIYATTGNEPIVLTIAGNSLLNSASIVYLNATRIINPAFANSTLTWNSSDGNPNNGSITFAMPDPSTSGFLRSANGMVWTGDQPPSGNNFAATEQLPPDNPLGVWAGEYQTQVSPDGVSWTSGPTLVIGLPDLQNPAPTLTVNSTPVTDYTFTGSTLSWDGNNQVSFAMAADTVGSKTLTGSLEGAPHAQATSTPDYSSSYQGQYVTQMLNTATGQWNPFLPAFFDGVSFVIGHQKITPVSYSNLQLRWSGGTGAAANGELTFSINIFNNQALFQGYIWAAGATQPTSVNFRGTWSADALQSWSGTYNTNLNNAAGPPLFIQGQAPPAPTQVIYQGNPVTQVAFAGDQLTGNASTQQLSALFTYSVDQKSQTIVRAFRGSVTTGGSQQDWSSAGQSNDVTLWTGTYQTLVTQADGTQVPGPVLEVVATSATQYSIKLSLEASSATLTNTAYTATSDGPLGNALSWFGNEQAPAPQYANAAIAFYSDAVNQTKCFKGSYFKTGTTAPKAVNWTGCVPHGVVPVNPPTDWPWWKILAVTLGAVIGAGIAIGAGIWVYRYCTRFAYQQVSNAEELAVCKKTN